MNTQLFLQVAEILDSAPSDDCLPVCICCTAMAYLMDALERNQICEEEILSHLVAVQTTLTDALSEYCTKLISQHN